MLKYVNYNIVFQEIPNETTLAINISGCPNRCAGCHSVDLQKDIGEVLDEKAILELLSKYQHSVTCICFMGGDNCPQTVETLAGFVRRMSLYQMKTAWYSGKSKIPEGFDLKQLSFIKLGSYIKEFGALTSSTTNQRFYKIEDSKMIDLTQLFSRNTVFASV